MKKYSSLFTIALVLDFASPKVPPILRQKYTPRGDYKKVLVYPLRATSPSTDAISDCNHVIGLSIKPEEVSSIEKQWNYKDKSPLPLAEAIRKIEFEVIYHLRTLDQVIFVSDEKKDSCGDDPCKALSHFRATATSLGRKIHVQMIGPLQCPNEKDGFLSVSNSDALTPAQLVSNGRMLKTTARTDLPVEKTSTPSPLPSLHPTPTPTAIPKPLPSPSGEILDNNLQIEGPPITITLERERQVLTVTSPALLKVPTGEWEMKFSAPSWLKSVLGKKVRLNDSVLLQLNLRDDLKDRLVWIDSSDEDEQVVLLGDPPHVRKILVPPSSPAVPVPVGSHWKIVH